MSNKQQRSLTKQEKLAIRSVAEGVASEPQQQLAMYAIIHKISGAFDNPYRAGNPDATTFACGQMRVGQDIHAITKTEKTSENL